MDREKALDKVRKLLAVARCETAAEAGLAAAKAQVLIDRFRLEEALLEEESRASGATASAETRASGRIIYTFPGVQVSTWVLQMATGLADLNGCVYWYRSGWDDVRAEISAAGRESDLATFSALLAYLTGEIESITRHALAEYKHHRGRGAGRTWANSFRLGAVATIRERLEAAHEQARLEARNPALAYQRAIADGDMEKLIELDERQSRYALVKVEQALERLDARVEAASAWVEENLRLRSESRRSYSFAREGFARGREAGHQVGLEPGRRRLK